MEQITPFRDLYNWLYEIHLILIVVLTSLLCTLLYLLSDIVCEVLFPNPYRILNVEDKAEWNSRIVSNIHAVWSVIGCFLMLRQFKGYDFFSRSSLSEEIYFGTLLGYLLYDSVLLLTHKKLCDIDILFHHFCGLIIFGILSMKHFAEFIAVLFYATEGSNPFINQRWFFEKCKMKESNWYLFNGFLMWLAFLSLRIALVPVSFYMVFQNYKELVETLGFRMSIFLLSLTSLFLLLNCYWFSLITYGLYKTLQRRSCLLKQLKETHTKNH